MFSKEPLTPQTLDRVFSPLLLSKIGSNLSNTNSVLNINKCKKIICNRFDTIEDVINYLIEH